MKTRAILNRIMWDSKLKNQQGDFTLTFIHRGAPNDEKTITYTQIVQVLASWFVYKDEAGEEVQIPFHRILNIKNIKRNKFLYLKQHHSEEDEFFKKAPPNTIPE
jgi:uncharacterized protein (UPF0248 family)